ncbi:MAG: hypothetical protein OXN84_02895 [Albidovulum sp.]|nr:hypothetical protein [Albidovulum sp.]
MNFARQSTKDFGQHKQFDGTLCLPGPRVQLYEDPSIQIENSI